MTATEKLIFTRFSVDLMSYTLNKHGIAFDLEMTKIVQKFHPKIGDAVLFYRETHEEDFMDLMNDFPAFIFESEDTIEEYIELSLESVFIKEGIFLLQVIKVCAFMLDLAIQCHEYADRNFIYCITQNMGQIFTQQICVPLKVVGGFHALVRFSEQLLEYNGADSKETRDNRQIIGHDINIEAACSNSEKFTRDLNSGRLEVMDQDDADTLEVMDQNKNDAHGADNLEVENSRNGETKQ